MRSRRFKTLFVNIGPSKKKQALARVVEQPEDENVLMKKLRFQVNELLKLYDNALLAPEHNDRYVSKINTAKLDSDLSAWEEVYKNPKYSQDRVENLRSQTTRYAQHVEELQEVMNKIAPLKVKLVDLIDAEGEQTPEQEELIANAKRVAEKCQDRMNLISEILSLDDGFLAHSKRLQNIHVYNEIIEHLLDAAKLLLGVLFYATCIALAAYCLYLGVTTLPSTFSAMYSSFSASYLGAAAAHPILIGVMEALGYGLGANALLFVFIRMSLFIKNCFYRGDDLYSIFHSIAKVLSTVQRPLSFMAALSYGLSATGALTYLGALTSANATATTLISFAAYCASLPTLTFVGGALAATLALMAATTLLLETVNLIRRAGRYVSVPAASATVGAAAGAGLAYTSGLTSLASYLASLQTTNAFMLNVVAPAVTYASTMMTPLAVVGASALGLAVLALALVATKDTLTWTARKLVDTVRYVFSQRQVADDDLPPGGSTKSHNSRMYNQLNSDPFSSKGNQHDTSLEMKDGEHKENEAVNDSNLGNSSVSFYAQNNWNHNNNNNNNNNNNSYNKNLFK